MVNNMVNEYGYYMVMIMGIYGYDKYMVMIHITHDGSVCMVGIYANMTGVYWW